MKLEIFQIDAFTDQCFKGNPAAVIPLQEWLPDATMQNIALENNLSETAFFVQQNGEFHLRWFTPLKEVDLCGHATLATGHALWEELGHSGDSISFHTRSGIVGIKKMEELYELDFPTDKIESVKTPETIISALKTDIIETYAGREDYLVRLPSEEGVVAIKPDFKLLGSLKTRGVLVSAPGNEFDFVSRCFFPYFGVDEDPVTGSAHTTLAPYWAKILGKEKMIARQISSRGGSLKIELKGDRTAIAGKAVTYLKGHVFI